MRLRMKIPFLANYIKALGFSTGVYEAKLCYCDWLYQVLKLSNNIRSFPLISSVISKLKSDQFSFSVNGTF